MKKYQDQANSVTKDSLILTQVILTGALTKNQDTLITSESVDLPLDSMIEEFEQYELDIEKAEQEISEQDKKPGKRFIFAPGYFTMIGKELHDKVNQMTLKKYQD